MNRFNYINSSVDIRGQGSSLLGRAQSSDCLSKLQRVDSLAFPFMCWLFPFLGARPARRILCFGICVLHQLTFQAFFVRVVVAAGVLVLILFTGPKEKHLCRGGGRQVASSIGRAPRRAKRRVVSEQLRKPLGLERCMPNDRWSKKQTNSARDIGFLTIPPSRLFASDVYVFRVCVWFLPRASLGKQNGMCCQPAGGEATFSSVTCSSLAEGSRPPSMGCGQSSFVPPVASRAAWQSFFRLDGLPLSLTVEPLTNQKAEWWQNGLGTNPDRPRKGEEMRIKLAWCDVFFFSVVSPTLPEGLAPADCGPRLCRRVAFVGSRIGQA